MSRSAPVLLAVVCALLVVADAAGAPTGSERSLPLDAAVAPDGTVVVVACADGRTVRLTETPLQGEASSRAVDLPRLPSEGKIAQVRVAPSRRNRQNRLLVTLALAIAYPDSKQEYRLAIAAPDEPDQWTLTDPIFTETGALWRVVAVSHTDRGIEILFDRGYASPRLFDDGTKYEARLYENCCPGGADALIPGAARLWDLRRSP